MTITLLCIVLTITAYVASRHASRRYAYPFTYPVFLSTALIVATLLLFDVSAADYEPAKQILTLLLGPATVALAVPVYRNRRTLFAHLLPATFGIVLGCITTVAAVVVLGRLLWFDRDVVVALSAKSVTAPIAVELATILQTYPALTVAFVIATGMLGAMFGPWLMDRVGITDPLARGLSLGTISHGQGTAQALSEGELQGAIAGIGMGLGAVLTSAALPFAIRWLA
jgi:putative effector of murein hydrolase